MQITINNQTVDATEGETILATATRAEIDIPTLCHHADLTPVGSCRLCIVEIDGWSRPQTSCNLVVQDGMQIVTESENLNLQRRLMLEQLLEHYHEPESASQENPNEFQRLIQRYEVEITANNGSAISDDKHLRHPVDQDPNPFIAIDLNQCILCTRCVRACEEVQGRFVWNVAGRGDQTRVVCGADTTMLDARCESCGACAAYCPTGALSDRFEIANPHADRKVRTTCPCCGVGCQFDLHIKDEKIVRVSSNPEAPVNGTSLCVKGRYGFEFVHHVIRSRRGKLVARALITNRVSARVVFANFHFPGEGNANNLTICELDPIAKIPEYKVCAVAISAAPQF